MTKNEKAGIPSIRRILAKKIKLLRFSRGWSQETLAELCGFSRSYIANIETGKHNLSLDNLERIAEAFEVPIAELLNPDFNLRIEQPGATYFLGAAYS
ncbi:MAG TPA: helix-turn-helix transcriptional regulator [Acidiferrobacterales bacterium]|nr:helix-turn-helix transcriptional regulator [Acidiferrobacterales bacterium]